MKKRWIIMLALALLLLAACGGKQEPAQTESPAKPKTVAPLAPDLSLEDLEDCTFAAAFEPSDVHVTEGDLVITLAPYYTPKYDGADIGSLAPGDTLVLTDRQLKVEALERNGNHVAVNGGTEKDGCDLYTQEEGLFFQAIPDWGSVLVPLGEVTLSVDPGFVFTDNSDPENPGWQISAGDFLMSMENRTDSFRPEATVVRTAGGRIVELTKNYLP